MAGKYRNVAWNMFCSQLGNKNMEWAKLYLSRMINQSEISVTNYNEICVSKNILMKWDNVALQLKTDKTNIKWSHTIPTNGMTNWYFDFTFEMNINNKFEVITREQ